MTQRTHQLNLQDSGVTGVQIMMERPRLRDPTMVEAWSGESPAPGLHQTVAPTPPRARRRLGPSRGGA
jgi:hypothetical protein